MLLSVMAGANSRPLGPPGEILYDGNSLGAGSLLLPGQGFTWQCNDVLIAAGYQFGTYNASVGGQTTADMLVDVVPEIDSRIVLGGQLTRNHNVSTIAGLESGINDIRLGASLATMLADQEAWLAGRRAAGATTLIVLLCRCDPVTVGGSYEADRVAANEIWRTTNRPLVDIVVDGVNDPAFLSAVAPLSPGYLPDGVHWNPYGANIRGICMANAIMGYVQMH